MGLFDDEKHEAPAVHRLGEDLSSLSLEELAERIDLLKAEIGRIERAIETKKASRDLAAGFFKT